jgi:hypothetical protein
MHRRNKWYGALLKASVSSPASVILASLPGIFLVCYLFVRVLQQEERIHRLEVIRAGVPFDTIPLQGRIPSKTSILGRGKERLRVLQFKSTVGSGANKDDILYLIDAQGMVIAAWSLDSDEGRTMAHKITSDAKSLEGNNIQRRSK